MKLFFFLTLLSYIIASSLITPENIIEMLSKNTTLYDKEGINCYIIKDSNKYINLNEYDALYNIMKDAQNNTGFEYVLIILDELSLSAKKFAENLQQLMVDNNFIVQQKSIMMVFDMYNQQFSIEEGYDALQQFPAERVQEYLDFIVEDLRNKNYYTAFSTLLGYFRDNYKPSVLLKVLAVILFIVLVIVFIVIRFVCRYYCGCRGSISYSYRSHGGGAKAHGSGASGGW